MVFNLTENKDKRYLSNYQYKYLLLHHINHIIYKGKMEKKTIVARVEVLPGKEQEFISKAEPLIQGTRAEEGNISYNLYQNPANPVAFIFYEEYKDRQAMDVHAASAHFQAFGKAIEGLLASDLIIESF